MSTQMSIQEEALTTLLTGPETVTRVTRPRDLTRLPTEFVAVEENRADLLALGFDIGEVEDDLFTAVTPPRGWGLVSTDHYMYSHVLDEQGRIRGQLGYKGDRHDRWASFYFLTRFMIEAVQPEDWFWIHRPKTLTKKVKRKVLVEGERECHRGRRVSEWGEAFDDLYGVRFDRNPLRPEPRYEMREVEEPLPDDQQPQPQAYAKGLGVKDRAIGAFVFETDTYMCAPQAYREHEIAEEPLKAEALAWLDAHFPEHKSVVAYW